MLTTKIRSHGRPSMRGAKSLVAAIVLGTLSTGCVYFDRLFAPKSASPEPQTEGGPASYPTVCLGDATASKRAIFLHGIMPNSAKALESEYLGDLTILAREGGLRLAVPRSTQACKDGPQRACWLGNDQESIARTYQTLVRSTAPCFPEGAPFGLIGFSNGGYYVGRVVMRCLKPQPAWALTIGSAGDLMHATSDDLGTCAPTMVLVGEKDMVKNGARLFAEALAKKKLRVQFKTYPGGHTVPYRLLRDLISQFPH